jgi:membrane-bound metal-dependent hydrolase YbcI (DUF457 family)
MVIAGTLADVDFVSVLFGPAAYLAGHRTCTHSVLGTLAIAAIAVGIVVRLGGRKTASFSVIVIAAVSAAVLHVLLDLCQADGETLFWPFRGTRYTGDVLPGIDPCILAILLAGIVIPEVFRLVSSDIGAKERSPRGRNGAVAALVLVLTYVGVRIALHAESVAILDAHTYRGESPRRLASFPDAFSILKWHGVVETESQLCQVEVPLSSGGRFDAEAANCLHKPEASVELTTAEGTDAAKTFLRAGRFPRAAVEQTQEGFEVVIRELRETGAGVNRYSVAALILLDKQEKVTNQELVWARELRVR